MPDQPTTARAEAVRAWAYDAIMQRPPGLSIALSVATVSMMVLGAADDTRVMVSAEEDDPAFPGQMIGPDDLAEGAGLLLGAADALQALSVLAEAEQALRPALERLAKGLPISGEEAPRLPAPKRAKQRKEAARHG